LLNHNNKTHTHYVGTISYEEKSNLNELKQTVREYRDSFESTYRSSLEFPVVPHKIQQLLRVMRGLQLMTRKGMLMRSDPSHSEEKRSVVRLAAYVSGFRFLEMFASDNDEVWNKKLRSAVLESGIDFQYTVLYIRNAASLSKDRIGMLRSLLLTGDDAKLMTPRDRDRGQTHVLEWLAKRNYNNKKKRYFTPSDAHDLFRRFVQTHIRMVFDEDMSCSLNLDPLRSHCVISLCQSWNQVSLTDLVHELLISSCENLLKQFSLCKTNSTDEEIILDENHKLLSLQDYVIKSFVKIMANAHEHAEKHSYQHVNVSSYMKCVHAFRDSIHEHSEKHNVRVNAFKSGIEGVKHMKREIKRVKQNLKKSEETFKSKTMKLTKLQTELETQTEALNELIDKSQPAETQFAELLERVQVLSEKKKAHDEHVAKLSEKAQEILNDVNTNRVLDTFKESTPPEIVMWIVESIAIVIGEHDFSGAKLDWEDGEKLFRDETSLISRLGDAASRFSNWERAIMKRVWDLDSLLQSSDILSLARWFLLRKQIFEDQTSFEPSLSELQSLEPELEKERVLIQKVRGKVDEARHQVETSEGHVKTCTEELKLLKETIEGLEDLHGKFEHVLACLKRRVTKWTKEMSEETRTFRNLLGEWILGASYRAFLLRMPTSTRLVALKNWRDIIFDLRIPLSSSLEHSSSSSSIIESIVNSEVRDVNVRKFLRDKWQSLGVPNDPHAFWTCLCIHRDRCLPSSAAIVQNRTDAESVVLIDPNNWFSRWILTESEHSISKNESTIHSFDLKSVSSSLCQSIENGTTLSIDRVTLRHDENIDLAVWPHCSDEKDRPKLQSALSQLGDKAGFRIFLSSPDVIPRTCEFVNMFVVDCTEFPEGLRCSVERTIESNMWFEDAKEMKVMHKLSIQNASENIALTTCESKILNILSKIEEKKVSSTVDFKSLYPVLDEMTSLDTKIKNIQTEIQALKRDRDFERVRNRRASDIVVCIYDTCQNISKKLCTFYDCLRGNEFVKVCAAAAVRTRKALDRSKKEEENKKDDVDLASRSLGLYVASAMFERFRPTLHTKHALAVSTSLLLSLFSDHNIDQDSRTMLHFLQHNSSSSSSSETKHFETRFEEANPETNVRFQDLLTRLRNSNMPERDLLEIVNSTQFYTKVSSTSEDMFQGLDIITRLHLLSTVRPDRMAASFLYLTQGLLLGERYSTLLPTNSLEDMYNDMSLKRPGLVYFNNSECDPIQHLSSFAKSRGEVLKSVSMHDCTEREVERDIQRCRERGEWIVLSDVKKTWYETKLPSMFETLSSSNSHLNFRIWILHPHNRSIPSSMRLSTSSILYRDSCEPELAARLLCTWKEMIVEDDEEDEIKSTKVLWSACVLRSV